MRSRHEPDLDGPFLVDGEKSLLGVREGSPRVPLDGVTLAWETSGEGVPVVCLHAAGHGARDFKLLQQKAPAGCRLLLLDWPGHGRSSADPRSFTVERCVGLLLGFLGAQGLRSAVLLGSEFGASVALAFAIQHPERVRGLVLCQPSGLLPSMPPGRFSGISGDVRRPARMIFRKPHRTAAQVEQMRVDSIESQHALQCNQAALSILALEDTLRTGLAQGLCPTMVVLASRSHAYPLKPFQRFLEPMLSVTPMDKPGRPKLAIFPGRHSPLWENPGRMAQVLSGFAGATMPLDAHQHSWTLAAVDWPARGMNQWICTHPRCNAAQALPAEENPNRRTFLQ